MSSWGLFGELTVLKWGCCTLHLGARLAWIMESPMPISNPLLEIRAAASCRVHHQRAAVHTDTMEPPHLREEKTEVGRELSNAPRAHRENCGPTQHPDSNPTLPTPCQCSSTEPQGLQKVTFWMLYPSLFRVDIAAWSKLQHLPPGVTGSPQ